MELSGSLEMIYQPFREINGESWKVEKEWNSGEEVEKNEEKVGLNKLSRS